jgi:hypothetical protein
VGKAGCVLTAIAMALRHFGAKAGATPLDVNNAGLLNKAFAENSSSAFVRKLINSQKDLVAGDDVSGEDFVLNELIHDTLNQKGVVLAHVDYDEKIGGDSTGEHWVLIFQHRGSEFVAADSATATNITMDEKTLSALVLWKTKEKRYKVKRIIPIYLN